MSLVPITFGTSLTAGCLFSLNNQEFSLIFIFLTAAKETVIVVEFTIEPNNSSVCKGARTDSSQWITNSNDKVI